MQNPVSGGSLAVRSDVVNDRQSPVVTVNVIVQIKAFANLHKCVSFKVNTLV